MIENRENQMKRLAHRACYMSSLPVSSGKKFEWIPWDL